MLKLFSYLQKSQSTLNTERELIIDKFIHSGYLFTEIVNVIRTITDAKMQSKLLYSLKTNLAVIMNVIHTSISLSALHFYSSLEKTA